MKLYNHDVHVSDSEMHAMLKKANLAGRGYKKEVVVKVVHNAEGGEEYRVCTVILCVFGRILHIISL